MVSNQAMLAQLFVVPLNVNVPVDIIVQAHSACYLISVLPLRLTSNRDLLLHLLHRLHLRHVPKPAAICIVRQVE